MRRIFFLTGIVVFIGICFNSCYYDVEQDLYPSGGVTCDTTHIGYTANVLPIIQQYCNSCHSAVTFTGSGGGVNLDGYDQTKVYVDNGQLASAINHTDRVSPMPKNAAPLSSCNRAIINRWILNSSPNN